MRACIAAIVLAVCALPGICWGTELATDSEAAFATFVGTTPCDTPIRRVLEIPADAKSDIVQWTLTLYQDAQAATPTRYEIRFTYGTTAQGKPGLTDSPDARNAIKTGTWRIITGTKSAPQAAVYDLGGDLALIKIDDDLIHLLNADKSLMLGNGGWSCSLNRREAAEPDVDPALTLNRPSISYQIAPLATGPNVFGVFEGRTPYQRVARELKLRSDPGSLKCKWRVTLYQDPVTHSPTTYKVEGTAHRDSPREGKWSIVQGTSADPKAMVYRLAETRTESPIFLLEGDRNVLFFVDQNGKPLIGGAEFGYTLNRRERPPEFETKK